MKHNRFKQTVLAIVAVFCASCTCTEGFTAYVKAHRLAYNVTAGHYSVLVSNSNLNPADKATHLRRVQAENEMITAAEKLLGIKL